MDTNVIDLEQAFIDGFNGVPPQADTDDLAETSERILLYNGGTRSPSFLRFAPRHELTAGWVIAVRRVA